MPLSKVASALLVPLLWGLQYVIIKVGLEVFPPLFFVGLRFAAVAAILLPFVGCPSRKAILPIVGISIFMGGLNFGLTFVALAQGPAGVSSVINQLSSPFMVLLAWPMLHDRPTIRVMIGVAIAFAGVILIMIGPNSSVALVPALLIAGSALSLAIGSVLSKRYGPLDPIMLLGWMSLFTVPQVLGASLILEHGQLSSIQHATLATWLAFSYTVIFGGIIAFSVWLRLIAQYSIGMVAPFALLQVVFAVGAGIVFLNEPMTWSIAIGVVLCVGGVLITQLQSKHVPPVPVY